MREGQASRTAVLVAMGRAVADGRSPIPGYADPIAWQLLDDDARARVERVRAGVTPKKARERFDDGYLKKQALMMAARTVAIDDAVRAARAPQVVILGAGLDTRAWRMEELKDAVVFEVDHPDSQREKRARLDVAHVEKKARDVRFVAVDFTRDDLEASLAQAGHDASQPTMWIWEGVVMYLEQSAIEATLSVIARRSAPGSRVAVLYHAPKWLLFVLGPVLAWVGEPLRSRHKPDEMRALLLRFGFSVLDDDDVAGIVGKRAPAFRREAEVANHLRIAVAARS